MKNKLFCYIVFVLVSSTIIFSCNKSPWKNKLPKKYSTDVHKNPHYQEMFFAEIQSYYSFAKTAKTEYQLDSFIDKLPLIRESQVKEMKGEENWRNFLEWLKQNGAKVLSTNEDGVPDLSQRERSPYEKPYDIPFKRK